MTESGIVKMLMQSSTINSHLEHQIKYRVYCNAFLIVTDGRVFYFPDFLNTCIDLDVSKPQIKSMLERLRIVATEIISKIKDVEHFTDIHEIGNSYDRIIFDDDGVGHRPSRSKIDVFDDDVRQVLLSNQSMMIFFNAVVVYLNDVLPKENQNEIGLSTNIDDILNKMFTLTDSQLTTLKKNLSGNFSYIGLTYIGKKISLWNDLAKLLTAGIDRKFIARVFSEYCKWQSSQVSESKTLNINEIYRKIDKKGTN
jgi:hypothetical protein